MEQLKLIKNELVKESNYLLEENCKLNERLNGNN